MLSIRIVPSAVTKVLSAVVVFLVVTSLAGQIATYVLGYGTVFGLVNLFSLDREGNIPTWFSSLILLWSAILLAVITVDRRAAGHADWKYWGGLSVIFTLLSFDEAASIHEITIEPMQQVLGVGGVLHWAWVIPGMAFVILIAAVYFRFLFSQPAATRRLFIVAAVLYVGGALGMEMLGAGWFAEHGRRNMGYVLFWTVEETMEMFGVVVFIHALTAYLAQTASTVAVQFGRETRDALQNA